MPLFAIIAHDRPDTGTLRADTRPRHLPYLEAIVAQTVAAGPMLDESGLPTGSLIIADFADLDAAKACAAARSAKSAMMIDPVGTPDSLSVGPATTIRGRIASRYGR